MSRIRSIHPGLFTDEAFVSLSPLARIFAMGIWTEADDDGVFEWSPLKLKMRILPADNADAAALLAEMVAVGMAMRYDIDGRAYGAVRNFCQYQRPQKPKAIHPKTKEVCDYINMGARDKRNGNIPVQDDYDTSTVIPRQMDDGGCRIEEEAKASLGSSDPTPEVENDSDGKAEGLKPEHIVEVYNEQAGRIGKPVIRKLTPERRALLRARIAGYTLDEFREVLGNVERSPFLRGDTGWKGCGFDWIFKKSNFQKILEGNYNG